MSDPNPQTLRDWDRQHVWHAFTQMAEYEPLIFERAAGCTLIDIDGRRYLDGVSSLWCNVHGHHHESIDAAVRAQLDQVAHCTSLGASNPATIRLARRLAELAPGNLEHVFFSSDGTCAVEAALKIAFQYWQQRSDPRPAKTRFVAFDGAYHGDTVGSVSLGGVARFHAMFAPLLFDVWRLPPPDAYRFPPGVATGGALDHYLAEAESLLAAHHQQIAALVIEPLVQCAAGIVMHPPGYLRGLRDLTRKYDILLIADEVAVGMGRIGTMFACEQEAVQPDLLCLAKGLTGGYLPLAATVASDDIYQAFLGDYVEMKTFFHGHTYSGNPLGAAAALATLEVFQREQTLAQLVPKIDRLAEHLTRIAAHPHVGNVRQRGLLAGIDLVLDRDAGLPFAWQERRGLRVCQHALSENVWLRPLGDVIVIMPPLAISLAELDQILLAIERGIEAATVGDRSG